MNKNLMDSNALPQTRGTPAWFARGAPVVAQKQPIVRGRPLAKLRDGPALEFFNIAGTRYWYWNAPPDNGTSVALRGNSVVSVVKKENKHRVHREDTEYTKNEVALKSSARRKNQR